MIFVIHHYDRRLLKKSLHISFLLKWEFGGAFSHPVRHRARVTPLVGGKRQGSQKVIYQVHSHASDSPPRYLPLQEGACLGILDILGVWPSRPGDHTPQGLFPQGIQVHRGL